MDIEAWLRTYVNSPDFIIRLEKDIDNLEKPGDRVKAKLELMSYLAPKVKNVDAPTPDQQIQTIEITYSEAKPPKKPKGKP